MKLKNGGLTGCVIKCFLDVYDKMGAGFSKDIYEKAMMIEMENSNIKFKTQHPVNIYYKEDLVGNFIAEFLVDQKLIIVLKNDKEITKSHENELLNKLRVSNYKLGLILNFGDKAEIKRKFYDPNITSKKTGEKKLKIAG